MQARQVSREQSGQGAEEGSVEAELLLLLKGLPVGRFDHWPRPLTRSGCTGTLGRPLLLRLRWLAGRRLAGPGYGGLHPS